MNHIVSIIEGWMSTYFLPPFDGSGGIGGPIATYWASSPYMAGPYVMNSYGVIRGLCARGGDANAGDIRLRAEMLALYYVRCQDPTTGLFICSWGEDPFSGYGLVQQASVVAALWDLHRLWPDKDVEKAARLGWKACFTCPALHHIWNVNNQILRCGEAVILGVRARGDSKPAGEEKALLERIGHQVAQSQWGEDSPVNGAISQALSNDDIILPYQGKCLTPLVMLAESLGDPLYLEVARRLADFIVKNLRSAGMPLISGQHRAEGAMLSQARRIYKLRRLIPFAEPSLRKYRKKKTTHWHYNPWPKWIARGLDTARGLFHLGQALGEEIFTRAALEMVRESLKYLTPLGGMRNTLGFWREDPENMGGMAWQDAVAIPRWNSYAIQFFHELASGTPVLPPRLPEVNQRDEVELAGDVKLIETREELRLVTPENDILWQLRKGHRWGRPFRQVPKWNEGGVATGQKV
jgi:hypothetical protein